MMMDGGFMSQGVDIELNIFQTLLSLVTSFPVVHARLLTNVSTNFIFRAAQLRTDYASVAPQACYHVSSCTNPGRPLCRPRRQRRCGN